MIIRGNAFVIRDYLKYRAEVDQLSSSSIRLEEGWLRYLLEWAQDRPFEEVPRIRPALPEYMLSARLDGKEGQLSGVYIKKVISASRRFLGWLVKHKPGYTTKITAAWLDTLKPPRLETETKEHEAVTLEEIRAIAAAPVFSMRDKRIRAAVVFMFLSAMRVGAFVTMPIKALDLETLTVKQWPSMGVHTKFSKKATTYLLNIPDLLRVVKEWDREVRASLVDSSFWFAPFSPETGTFDPGILSVGNQRKSRVNKDLKDWLERVELPYHSAHKFRHGHAVYGIQHSKDVGDLKAVSMNLMHSNLSITDGVYGVLSSADVGKRIAGLGVKLANGDNSRGDIASQIIALVEMLKNTAV
jgi:site-specific recombinase XerC